jgi:hypothetical protein
MARRYEFGSEYTPEEAYAVPQYQRGSYWGNSQGGSLTQGPQQGVPAMTPPGISGGQASTGLRSGEIMGNMREAESGVATPNNEGFKASSNAGGTFASSGEALSKAQGNAATTALAGTGQAMMDRKQGYDDLIDWMGTETRNIQASNEQKADSRKKKGGGIFGAIGTIAGSLVGGPIGAGIGALGSLFG